MKKYFEEMKLFFSAGLNELDLIKLKEPFEEKSSGIIEGNSKLYNEKIESHLLLANNN